MQKAILLMKAKQKLAYDNMTKPLRIMMILMILLWMAGLGFSLIDGINNNDEDALQMFSFYSSIFSIMGMMMICTAGNFPRKMNWFNKKLEYDFRKVFLHMPFTFGDFAKSIYLSWLIVYAIGAVLNIIGIATIYISGITIEKSKAIGFGVFIFIFISLFFGITNLNIFSFGKSSFKIFNGIITFSRWILYFVFLIFINISENIYEKFDFTSAFSSLYMIIAILIIPIIVLGFTVLIAKKHEHQAWLNI